MKEAFSLVILKKDYEVDTIGSSPNHQELIKLMHLLSCDAAVRAWKDHWTFCPVCMSVMDGFGVIEHKDKRAILV